MFVDEAYEELGVGPTQFANLRKQVLQGALDALEPRPVGRPRRASQMTDDEVEAMQERIVELERDAKILRTRLELAVLPLLQEKPRPKSGAPKPPPPRRAAPPE
jgi:hypothetical protein